MRSRQDTRGHVTKTVRDREAPGSNPGPPTILYSKSAISESLWSQRHTAGSQFPTEQPNRGGVNAVVVGNVRSWDSDRWPRNVPRRRTHRAGP